MITADGDLKVLEFNCRFGDPETRYSATTRNAFVRPAVACAQQRLSEMPPITWKAGAAARLLPLGYPHQVITELNHPRHCPHVFHAGTKLEQQLVTDASRFGLPEWGTIEEAIAYAAYHRIQFPGMPLRDIGEVCRKREGVS